MATKEQIRIRLISQPDNFYEFFVNVEMSSTIAQLKILYGQRVGIMKRHLVFKIKGFKGFLEDDSTPKSLNMKNGEKAGQKTSLGKVFMSPHFVLHVRLN